VNGEQTRIRGVIEPQRTVENVMSCASRACIELALESFVHGLHALLHLPVQTRKARWHLGDG